MTRKSESLSETDKHAQICFWANAPSFFEKNLRFPSPSELRISRIAIKNFRNFADLDVSLGAHAVIVGENKIGKSNLLYALRLILDPSLPDSARTLREEDFWDGLQRPLGKGTRILISVDLTDFEDDENQLAVLAEHLVETSPMTSRLTYVWQPLAGLTSDSSGCRRGNFVRSNSI